MAHRRRIFRGPSKKGATAFAPSVGRDGRSLGWESMSGASPTPSAIATALPTNAQAAGGINTNFVTMLPQNLTRGVVTLERLRGHIAIYFSEVELAAAFVNWPVFMSIQLVPLHDGAIVNLAVLSSRNAGDLESNRFLWRRAYMPQRGTPIVGPGALQFDTHNGFEVDVKSKRRFDRANWALILVADVEATAMTLHQISVEMRGLFRTADGV